MRESLKLRSQRAGLYLLKSLDSIYRLPRSFKETSNLGNFRQFPTYIDEFKNEKALCPVSSVVSGIKRCVRYQALCPVSSVVSGIKRYVRYLACIQYQTLYPVFNYWLVLHVLNVPNSTVAKRTMLKETSNK